MLRQEALESLLPPHGGRGGRRGTARGEASLDGLGLDLDTELGDLVEVALAGACALAHVGGGEQAVLRLLDEASRLREALAGNGDRVRALELLRGLILRGRGGVGGPHWCPAACRRRLEVRDLGSRGPRADRLRRRVHPRPHRRGRRRSATPARSPQLAAHGAVEPNLTDDLVNGDPAALARLDKIVQHARAARLRRAREAVVARRPHHLLRRAAADRPERSRCRPEARATARAPASSTPAWPTCSKPENQFDRDNGKLLEVYTVVRHAVRRSRCCSSCTATTRP